MTTPLGMLEAWSGLPVEEVGSGYRFTVRDDKKNHETKLCACYAEAINFALGVETGRKLERDNNPPSLTVPITQERYSELLEAEMFLNALEATGVNDWEGYEVAQDSVDA